jgi:hypothetical protein
MALNRSMAQEPAEIAEGLLCGPHDHLRKNEIAIAWRFRDDEPETQGQPRWYTVKKIGAEEYYELGLAGAAAHFRVSISEPVWNRLDERQRAAMVDEALCRMQSGESEDDGELVTKYVGPDFQGYYGNLERYGPWHVGVEKVQRSIAAGGQQAFPFEVEVTAEEVDETPYNDDLAAGTALPGGGEAPAKRERKRKPAGETGNLKDWQSGTAPN